MKFLLLTGLATVCVAGLFAQVPTISSFTPTSGAVGMTVTINGTNFVSAPALNIVHFGAAKAVVTTAGPSQLTVTVPAGATYQSISVTTGGLTAYSSQPFDVTFPTPGTIDVNSFSASINLSTDASPRGVVFGDIDGDGIAEVIVVSNTTGILNVFKNTSSVGNITGGTLNKFSFGTGTTGGNSVAVGDVDQDGDLDVIVANLTPGGTGVSVFQNTGSGINFTRFDLAAGTPYYSVAISDVDADGKSDIIAVQNGVGITIFRNSGGAGVVSFDSGTPVSTGPSPTTLAIMDLNGDSKPELVTACSLPPTSIHIMNNNGFMSFSSSVNISTGSIPTDIAIADFDGDGKPDLVVANGGTNIKAYRNQNSGGAISSADFSSGISFPVSGGTTQGLSVADFDGDGKADIAVSAGSTANYIYVFKNTGTSGSIAFAGAPQFPGGNPGFNLTAGDVDGDGKIDLIVSNQLNASISILRNLITLPTPTIGSFSPLIGPPGISVSITGTNFSTTLANNSVKFNGLSATVTAAPSATSITVTVPTGATTGPITVTVGGQTGTSSSDFTVLTINNLTPSSGVVGASVTITGTGFDGVTTANNFVQFNGTNATVNTSSSTTITTSVPTGAATGPVTVKVSGQTATSAGNFTVVVDTSPPQVKSNSTILSGSMNTAVTVSADFADLESGISTAFIKYRPIAGPSPNNFITVLMNSTGSTNYQGMIPAGAVTELGVEYKLQILNGANLWNIDSLKVYTSNVSFDTGEKISSYPSGTEGSLSTNYRIIAIPLAGSRTVNAVFNNVLGGYDPKIFRMFKYNGSTFGELTDNSVLTAGEGYWFIKVPSTDVDTGPGKTVNVSLSDNVNCNCPGPFTLTLNNGWNQIGNPYTFKISWDDVIAANSSVNLSGNSSEIRVYRGGATGENVKVLRGFEGGFVSFTGGPASIKIPVTKNAGAQSGRLATVDNRITNALDQPAWEILFDVQQGELHYKLGGLGMHPDAKEGFDYHDDFNAPRFFDFLEVKFPKSIYGMTFTKDVVPTAENDVWEFNVESNLKEEDISISWNNSYFGTAKEIYLLDIATHRATDMRSQNHCDFKRDESKKFRVVFGSAEFVKEGLIPDRVILYDPYPSPFVDNVSIEYALPKEADNKDGTIEIYNATGSAVATINTPRQTGLGRWVWESEGNARGLYIVRLKMGNQVMTKKLIKQ